MCWKRKIEARADTVVTTYRHTDKGRVVLVAVVEGPQGCSVMDNSRDEWYADTVRGVGKLQVKAVLHLYEISHNFGEKPEDKIG